MVYLCRCVYLYIYTHTLEVYTLSHTHRHTHTHIYIYTCVCVCVCVSVYVYMCIYIYIYIILYTNVHKWCLFVELPFSTSSPAVEASRSTRWPQHETFFRHHRCSGENKLDRLYTFNLFRLFGGKVLDLVTYVRLDWLLSGRLQPCPQILD
jgi:hypothetical protein